MDIDPFAVLASLDIHDVSSAARVTGGADTLIWRVERRGRSYALRLFRSDQHEAARREAIAMRAAAPVVPVPAILAQGVWQDRPAVLLEWCEGEPLADFLRQNPEAVHDLGVEFGRLHARINGLPAPPELVAPKVLLHYVQGDKPAGRAQALLHLDYHPLNVLTDGTRITAVIDWVNALPGDPRADFARTVSILRIAPIAPPPQPRELHSLRRALEHAWRQGYREVAGELDDLSLFYAIAANAMLPEYAARVANPEHWLQDRDLDPLRRWIRYWKHCAGI